MTCCVSTYNLICKKNWTKVWRNVTDEREQKSSEWNIHWQKRLKRFPIVCSSIFFPFVTSSAAFCYPLASYSSIWFLFRRSVRSVRWQHLWFISLAIWFQRGLNASTYTLVFFMTLKSQPCAHNAYISICIYYIPIRHTSIIFRFSYLRGISPRAMVPQRNRFDRKFCDDSRTHTNKCLCVCVQHRTSVFCFQSRRRGVVLKFFQ